MNQAACPCSFSFGPVVQPEAKVRQHIVYNKTNVHFDNAPNRAVQTISASEPAAVVNDINVSWCVSELRIKL